MIDVKKAIDVILDKFQQKPVLLWTNPNPSASFSAQTISLSLALYESLIIYYKPLSSYSSVLEYRVKCNESAYIVTLDPNNTDRFIRLLTCNSNGVVFQKGKINTADANNSIIPVSIYGIK